MIRSVIVILSLTASGLHAQDPFAVEVIDYSPAPGVFVCNPQFNDPQRALGAPVGGGTVNADLSSLVTLGGFGGSITLRFDHPVEDDLLNPFGVDAIVFSNALWQGGDPHRHVCESATIEIALDANEDGSISKDEGWFLIPGSHLSVPEWFTVRWDDEPCMPRDMPARTGAFMLPEEQFASFVVINPLADSENEGIFGYAEYTPTLVIGDLNADDIVEDDAILPAVFYTMPDDPLRVGITSGSGGGDAFDIAWAIDVTNGSAAGLTSFDFVRITTASHYVHPFLGELSAEIDAVADVEPDHFGDCDADGDIDVADHACLQSCAGRTVEMQPWCAALDRDLDGMVLRQEVIQWLARLTGPREDR